MKLPYTIFDHPPADFNSTVEVAGCFCEYEDKLLFLKRHSKSSQGNKWGIPGGKLEKGEDSRAAVIREIYEEVGVKISSKDLEEMGTIYVRLPHVDYVYHMFRKRFHAPIAVILAAEEHQESLWATYEEALQLPLIAGGSDSLHYYKRFLHDKRKT